MKTREFAKYSATGNDFIILGRDQLAGEDPSALARSLCPRRLAVGADGLLVIGRGEEGIEVLYRNADGSPAAFCGNGARCAAHFAWSRGLAAEHDHLRFETLTIEAEILERGRRVRVILEGVEPGPPVRGIDGGGLGILEGMHIQAGVPHVVLRVPAVAQADLATLFERVTAGGQPLDANLTLVEVTRDGHLGVRTWERGCGETLACGSAALAAATWARETLGEAGSWTILPPSGMTLTVQHRGEGRVALEGEVREVFRGRIG
ncbi:MAG: diaminopimelate epimerase [Acidobacteriota bacterium]|nr:diaminopimelate epimerase [Acidobacteriota bacterium]MDQ7088071.1 diaminopimelate epimerase [Acidobacteriota bacterium]